MTETNLPSEVWASGDAYEQYVGRWSHPVAREFLIWLEIPENSRWLDVGCGTGALSQTIITGASPAEVHGIDSSRDYVGYAREQMRDPRVAFDVGDAQSLPFPDETYDAVVSGLMLNFLPEPGRAVREMARVTRRGGTVATYVWDYTDGTQLMRYFWDSAVALDPAAQDLDEGRRFPLCQSGPLGDLFRSADLDDVVTRPLDVPTTFRDFDDYWSPFLGGQGPAPGYAMSLNEEHRIALREHIRLALPVETDGSIHLTARAWAVRGTR